jgi:hypothetical protein
MARRHPRSRDGSPLTLLFLVSAGAVPSAAKRPYVLIASYPELSPAAEPEGHGAARRHLPVTGI